MKALISCMAKSRGDKALNQSGKTPSPTTEQSCVLTSCHPNSLITPLHQVQQPAAFLGIIFCLRIISHWLNMLREGKRIFFSKEKKDTAQVHLSSALTCLVTCLHSALFLNVKIKTLSLNLIISLEHHCPAVCLSVLQCCQGRGEGSEPLYLLTWLL